MGPTTHESSQTMNSLQWIRGEDRSLLTKCVTHHLPLSTHYRPASGRYRWRSSSWEVITGQFESSCAFMS